MITVPKIHLERLDPIKIYNFLRIADTNGVGYATNYYLLTPDQKMFVDALVKASEEVILQQIEIYNEELGYFEEDYNDN